MPLKKPLNWMSLALALLLAACAGAPGACPPPEPVEAGGPPRPLIVDTDMGPDDWMALAYLLARPDVDVRAVTVAGTGLAHCEPGVANALGLLEMFGAGAVPVACGRDTAPEGNAFPAGWRANADSFAGLPLPAHDRAPSPLPAAELIAQTVQASRAPVELLALGPLTNVADALSADPALAAALAGITIMGGALEVPGNVAAPGEGGGTLPAEWNIYADPAAADAVFRSGAALTLVPLDATAAVPVDDAFYRCLRANQAAPPAEFVADLLATDPAYYVRSGAYYFWDPLAAAVLVNPTLAAFENVSLEVVTGGGPEQGRTRLAADGAAVRAAVSAPGEPFRREFLAVLNGLAR